MKKVSSTKYACLISANAWNRKLGEYTPQESQPTPKCAFGWGTASRGRFFPCLQDSVEPEAHVSYVIQAT